MQCRKEQTGAIILFPEFSLTSRLFHVLLKLVLLVDHQMHSGHQRGVAEQDVESHHYTLVVFSKMTYEAGREGSERGSSRSNGGR